MNIGQTVYFVKRSYVVEVTLTKQIPSVSGWFGVDCTGFEHGGHESNFFTDEIQAQERARDNAFEDYESAKAKILFIRCGVS